VGRFVVRTIQEVTTALAWCSPEGVLGDTLSLPAGLHWRLRVSPKGDYVALESFAIAQGSALRLFSYRFEDSAVRALPLGPSLDSHLVWAPDGKRLLMVSAVEAATGLYSVPVADSGSVRFLRPLQHRLAHALDWSVDGKWVLLGVEGDNSKFDLRLVSMSPGGDDVPFVQGTTFDARARFSPAGRWVAYESEASGRSEVYLQTFPEPSAPIQVSTGGGGQVAWSGDGAELFYLNESGDVVAVSVSGESVPRISPPTVRFRIHRVPFHYWDIRPDGKGCLVATRSTMGAKPRLIAVLP
jgi:Tol biopolymer transport system component